ncbi:MAG: peptidase MA domain-containing protein [Dehalococcoidia bacterium]|nr:peptidase MA domain-containing protein [Dehalococcoidia bacterium]
MIRRALIILFVSLILLLPAGVSADSGIKLLDSSIKIDFPNLLTFNVKAESSATITLIRLRYEVDKATYAPSFAEAWPNFQQGKVVSASWSWDMRKGSLPPGALITYWWIIEDETGDRFTSAKETVHFDDTRYEWQKITDNMITILWYKGSRSFADELLKAAVEARARLEADAGVILDKPISIYIYGNYRDLRGALVAPEEWTGGVAYAGFNIISIGISTNNLDWGKQAVAHEMGHLITHQVTASPFGSNIPPWLDEGLAQLAEGHQLNSNLGELQKAAEEGTLVTLKSLSSPFSADPIEAYYSYAKSLSVIEYLTSNFDKSKINDLLIQFNNGTPMDSALMNVYVFDLNGLDAVWTDWLMKQSVEDTEEQSSSIYRTEYLISGFSYTTVTG